MATSSFHDRIDKLPSYHDLPRQPGLPIGCIWGLWDTAEQKDELGSLNLLTPDVVAQAAQEVRAGICVSLNWPLNKPNVPVFQRQRFHHNVINNRAKDSPYSFDDEVSFNTQSGSQWDGLRHVVHRETGSCYNGVPEAELAESGRLGIHKWHERGGIVSRGILIDYVAYAERRKISYSPVAFHAISHHELEEAAHEQGLSFRQGDVLIVRSGLIKWYNDCTDSTIRDAFFANPRKSSVGVDATTETVEWLWNKHFAAVAGDALAWEAIPYLADRPSLHQQLLGLWGTPIGELWDLENLSSTCKKLGRYSFFLTSVPLNVPGGVASPPNAVAIF